MNNLDLIKNFVFATYVKLDIDRCLKYIFFTAAGTIGLLFLYKSTISKVLTIVFGAFCIAYYLIMVIKKERRKEPINSILVNNIFLFFLTVHMVCTSFLILSADRSIYVLLAYIASIFIVGFIYIWISRRNLKEPNTSAKTPQVITAFAGVGALLGISFAKFYLKPKYHLLSNEQELQFIGIILLVASLFTDICFVGFLKAYYIKKYKLLLPQIDSKNDE